MFMFWVCNITVMDGKESCINVEFYAAVTFRKYCLNEDIKYLSKMDLGPCQFGYKITGQKVQRG